MLPVSVRRRAALVLALSLAAAGAGLGCRKDKGKGAAASAGSGSVAPATPVALSVYLDERQVASKVELSGEPRALTALVPGLPPPGAWLALELVDTHGKVHTTMRPAFNHPGKVAVVAVGPDGVDVGFRFPDARGPLVDAVRGIARVTIKAKGDAGQIAAQAAGDRGGGDSGGNREHANEARSAAPTDLAIAITGVGGESTFTGDQLDALPVIKAPSGDTQTPGWSLIDVLAAAGVTRPQIVHLTDGEGATLRLDAADFDPAKAVLYLKLNRQGLIRFRLFRKKGEAWEVGGELRGLTKIHVVE
jgi:hypothetical protein